MDVGVKHCTIFIIVADDSIKQSRLLSTSACILLTRVTQCKFNQFEFIGDIVWFFFFGFFFSSCSSTFKVI